MSTRSQAPAALYSGDRNRDHKEKLYEEHQKFLKSVNIDLVQGFLFGRPLPKEDFEERLKNKSYE